MNNEILALLNDIRKVLCGVGIEVSVRDNPIFPNYEFIFTMPGGGFYRYSLVPEILTEDTHGNLVRRLSLDAVCYYIHSRL